MFKHTKNNLNIIAHNSGNKQLVKITATFLQYFCLFQEWTTLGELQNVDFKCKLHTYNVQGIVY